MMQAAREDGEAEKNEIEQKRASDVSLRFLEYFRPFLRGEPRESRRVERSDRDRAGLGALRPEPILAKDKFFTTSAAFAAKLFTSGADDGEGSLEAFLRRL